MAVSHLDVASLAAEWVAVAVTLVGLSSLVLQLTNFRNYFDKFHGRRGKEWLGPWAETNDESKQLLAATLISSSPRGPELHGTMKGFCNLNDIHVSRKPVRELRGKASWTAILSILHPNSLPTSRQSVSVSYDEKNGIPHSKGTVATATTRPILMEGIIVDQTLQKSWKEGLPLVELRHHREKVCTTISRTAFVTCLVLTNSYQLYHYSDASGLRAAYSGYSGTWQAHWPLGGYAEVEFFPLDSHDEEQEKHPLSFHRRADKCILMLLGIIECHAPDKPNFKLAFPEPRDEGLSVLKFLDKGFIAHGKASHLYNMMAGNPYDVDFLYREVIQPGEEEQSHIDQNHLKLLLPTMEVDLNRRPVKAWDKSQKYSILYVPPPEELMLATALDCLPWSPLGWSIHRGMQGLLLAFGERIMKPYRQAFAHTLKKAIEDFPHELEKNGWSASITRKYMPSNCATSVLGGGGDSGDSVRIVTAAARLLIHRAEDTLDETKFWRERWFHKPPPALDTVPKTQDLDEETVIALTKFFVLEWSNELYHKLYEDLPLLMLVA